MNICILGAGAWGTAMALHLDRCGHAVALVPRRFEHALEIASARENYDYPGFKLPHTIQIGCELAPVLMEAEVGFSSIPSKALRELCRKVADSLEGAWQLRLFVVMCKGLELDSFKTPSEVVQEFFRMWPVACSRGRHFAGGSGRGKTNRRILAIEPKMDDPERYQEAFSNASATRLFEQRCSGD